MSREERKDAACERTEAARAEANRLAERHGEDHPAAVKAWERWARLERVLDKHWR